MSGRIQNGVRKILTGCSSRPMPAYLPISPRCSYHSASRLFALSGSRSSKCVQSVDVLVHTPLTPPHLRALWAWAATHRRPSFRRCVGRSRRGPAHIEDDRMLRGILKGVGGGPRVQRCATDRQNRALKA
ncbi:hypothetical protein DAEQUDRAFT_182009 [Daedalea quercina L-15889]|uniref:Uncharacterized protein n=1 Tax=Daedalea quercina L-15889 TaxID=1314783 RepID=A0A165REZ5_9APHY|nr:hypothetical protein DAEQUDRAFT_182009 [Daedalea quercina L-15889]